MERESRSSPEVEIAGHLSESADHRDYGNKWEDYCDTPCRGNAGAIGLSPILCGNIGYPATDAAKEATVGDILVMELSSFQLMGIYDFKPDTALITNIY